MKSWFLNHPGKSSVFAGQASRTSWVMGGALTSNPSQGDMNLPLIGFLVLHLGTLQTPLVLPSLQVHPQSLFTTTVMIDVFFGAPEGS